MDLADLAPLLDKLDRLDPETLRRVHGLVRQAKDLERQGRCRESYLRFVREAWPSFIEGKHHEMMARAFEKVVRGDLKRVIINMPPRHTKSEFASFLLPAWCLGQYPEKKVIQTAHTAELAVGFGRKVRNLVGFITPPRVSTERIKKRKIKMMRTGDSAQFLRAITFFK